MEKGTFIVFEGIDGSGKTTQIGLLADRLRAEGRKVAVTAEPTSGTFGGMLRDALSGTTPRSPAEMALLFTLDRVAHNENPTTGIRRMLEEGYTVICDRYYYSTLAYQGSDTAPDWIAAMNLDCPSILRPDLCVFLDLTPTQSLLRISRGRAYTEIYETEDKLKAVRENFFRVFETLKKTDRVAVLDAYRDIDAVAEDVYQTVAALV